MHPDKLKIYLDDMRPAPEGWRFCTSYQMFVSLIRQCIRHSIPITHISFDHDLHISHYGIKQDVWKTEPAPEWLEVPSGYDACQYFIVQMKENGLDIPIMTCHSSNTQGKINIERLIASVTLDS